MSASAKMILGRGLAGLEYSSRQGFGVWGLGFGHSGCSGFEGHRGSGFKCVLGLDSRIPLWNTSSRI